MKIIQGKPIQSKPEQNKLPQKTLEETDTLPIPETEETDNVLSPELNETELNETELNKIVEITKLFPAGSKFFKYNSETPKKNFIKVKVTANFKTNTYIGQYDADGNTTKKKWKFLESGKDEEISIKFQQSPLSFVEDRIWFPRFPKTVLISDLQYTGELKDGKFHGKGVHTYKNGSKYDGEWVNGKQCGKGIYTAADGSKYDGYWQDGQKHGEGEVTYANGKESYRVSFKNGKIESGHGVVINRVETYKGQFQDGQFNGKGELKCKNGDVYNGWFKDGEIKDGTGKVNIGSEQYNGWFKDGQFDSNEIISNHASQKQLEEREKSTKDTDKKVHFKPTANKLRIVPGESPSSVVSGGKTPPEQLKKRALNNKH